MKKILYITTALILFSCQKQTDLPTPLGQKIVTPINTTQSFNQNFVGNWNCNTWIVDEITGATHRREFLFYEITGSTTNMKISLNDYISTTSFNQIITNSNALVDSNYFNNQSNPVPIKFKGHLLTDSTMMVYQYDLDGAGEIDTIQSQIFTKE